MSTVEKKKTKNRDRKANNHDFRFELPERPREGGQRRWARRQQWKKEVGRWRVANNSQVGHVKKSGLQRLKKHFGLVAENLSLCSSFFMFLPRDLEVLAALL